MGKLAPLQLARMPLMQLWCDCKLLLMC
jgi:hypothetical protein